MNEWQIAGIICVCVFLLNISLAIGSEIFQRLWAWIDDSKHNSLNWYLDKINYWKSEWKYPVYLRKPASDDPDDGEFVMSLNEYNIQTIEKVFEYRDKLQKEVFICTECLIKEGEEDGK